MSNPYKYPDLSEGAVKARLKRVERTVQYRRLGRPSDADATRVAPDSRTGAAWQLDRNGNIIANTLTGIEKIVAGGVGATGAAGAAGVGVPAGGAAETF